MDGRNRSLSENNTLQLAYFLHIRRYQDSSALLECFTREAGIVTCVAKGAKRPKSKWRSLVQPFILVHVAWRGRGDVKTLIQCEAEQILPALYGKKVLLGLYVNELVLSLLHRADPHSNLFEYYHQTIQKLSASDDDAFLQFVLRQFECQLLKVLGFGIDFENDAQGEPIIADVVYGYDPEEGFLPHAVLPQSSKAIIISGATIQALHQSKMFESGEQFLEAKKLMRQAICHQMGDKTLKTRKLFSELQYIIEKERG